MNRIALGTVQFGLPYGIANQQGQVSLDEARNILQHAEAAGLDTLDTAIAYGDSEQRLGEIGVSEWQVISKLPAVPDDCVDIRGWVRKSVGESLNRLRIAKLYGLLLHRPSQLLEARGDELYAALLELVAGGLVQKIGVSIYEPEELVRIFAKFDLTMVQAPFNILDHRLLDSGWLDQLVGRGVEVHARSIFLQGLLLMQPDHRPPQFKPWQAVWQQWQGWLQETGLTPLQACLRHVLAFPAITKIIVGVDSLPQLQAILQAVAGAIPDLPPDLPCSDPNLLNPSRWAAS